MSEAEDCIWPFVVQMKAASDAGLYWAALTVALVLPDMLGALQSENGRSTASKYKAWLDEFLGETAPDPAQMWGFRCSLLHQGSSHPHGGFPQLAFTLPGAGQIHNLSIRVGDDVIMWISVELYVEDLISAVRNWIDQYGSTKQVQRNLRRFARLRPDGLPPHVSGPIIA